MNKPLLYSSCFCRNFCSVVRVVSGRINFTALLCRESNLFLRTSGPSEVYCLWLYLEDGVLSLDQFSSCLERDRVVRVTNGVSVW